MGILGRVLEVFSGTGEAAREGEKRRMEVEARELEATARARRKRARALEEAGIKDTANTLKERAVVDERHARSVQRQILDSFGASRGKF